MELNAFEYKFFNEFVCCIRMVDYRLPSYEEIVDNPSQEDLIYVIAVNSYPSFHGNEHLEIYGIGKTFTEAAILAISTLVKCALKGINFGLLEECNLSEIFDMINLKQGTIEQPEVFIPSDEPDSEVVIHFDKNMKPFWMIT